MDHLSLPRGATIADSERAFCIADPYDGGPFLTFPQRSRFNDLYQKLTATHGWQASTWHFTTAESRELEIFLQTWLFFGLLHEIFGAEASASKFIDSRFYITTARLGNIVDEWTSKHHVLKNQDSVRLCEHLTECLVTTWKTSLKIHRLAKISSTILHSIAALCETLEDVVLGTLASGTARSMNMTWGWFHNFNAIQKVMVKNGWCPVDAAKWHTAANTFQGIYYLSKMKVPAMKDHSRCLGTVCIANQCEDLNLASKHAPDCLHGCHTLSVDESKLTAILGKGEVAILDITLQSNSSTPTISVIPANKKEKHYVAISHVWADGLGNPTANSLPSCQISRIAKMVQHLQNTSTPPTSTTDSTKLYIWLDTLCCPVKSLSHRAQCLVLMPQIYREATHVLVLDAQIHRYSSLEIDSLEIVARLLFSVWSTRLWTLQEGILARRGGLWIQLRDRAVNVEVVGEELIRRYGRNFLDGHLTLVLSSSLARLRRFVDVGRTGFSAANLVELRMAVRNREVSVKGDEALCLATCMGFDQREIVLAAAGGEGMGGFWRGMRESGREIPRGVVFFYGERLEGPGYRWAPSSLLGGVVFHRLSLPQRMEDVAVIKDIGLEVLFSGYEVVVPKLTRRNEWDEVLRGLESEVPIRYSSSRWYRIAIGCNVPGPWMSFSVIEILRRNEGKNVLLIDPALEDLSFVVGDGNESSQAVSGSIKFMATDGICLSVETTVVVGLVSEEDAFMYETAWRIARNTTLQRANRGLLRGPKELSVLPGHPQLSRLSNSILQELLAVAESALKENAALEQGSRCHRTSPRDCFAECLLWFMAGWYGEILQTWPESQRWFVD